MDVVSPSQQFNSTLDAAIATAFDYNNQRGVIDKMALQYNQTNSTNLPFTFSSQTLEPTQLTAENVIFDPADLTITGAANTVRGPSAAGAAIKGNDHYVISTTGVLVKQTSPTSNYDVLEDFAGIYHSLANGPGNTLYAGSGDDIVQIDLDTLTMNTVLSNVGKGDITAMFSADNLPGYNGQFLTVLGYNQLNGGQNQFDVYNLSGTPSLLETFAASGNGANSADYELIAGQPIMSHADFSGNEYTGTIPEPTTGLLAGAALVGAYLLGGRRRSRK